MKVKITAEFDEALILLYTYKNVFRREKAVLYVPDFSIHCQLQTKQLEEYLILEKLVFVDKRTDMAMPSKGLTTQKQ